MDVTVNGNPVFASTGGQDFDPSKKSIVFVHGAGMDHTVWGQQTRYFAHHGFNVLAVDLPGHGKSGGEALDSIDALADWIAAFIDAVVGEPVILVGHSMGAITTVTTAARHGDRVKAAALLGVAGKMPVHPVLQGFADSGDIRAAEMVAAWGHGARSHKGGNIASGIWLIGTAVRLVERAPKGVLGKDFAACNAWQGGEDLAAVIACPVLFLLGAKDKMTPVKAAKPLADLVVDSRTVILPDAGHMMMLEDQQATRAALMDFCKTVFV